MNMEYFKWCIEAHSSTNHMYDKYLPYEFHLRMVKNVAEQFIHLLPINLFTTEEETYKNVWVTIDITHETIYKACGGHDLIEDARKTYNDVKKVLGIPAAEIIRAVTCDGRGRTRPDRMPEYIYKEICDTPGATFVKLCDRIANVQYGKMMRSSQFDMYKAENAHFISQLGYSDSHPLKNMFIYLIHLFV